MTTDTIEHPRAVAEGNAWTQTGALLLDAYRDLQSRKLFWFSLVLSLLVASVFAGVGINPNGITIFGRLFPGAYNSVLIPPGDFFKFLFTTLAIPIWLGFLATILALVSVAGIFPDAISSGSIDLYLSRPIGRLRLFLTKYVFALLFAAIQVAIFSVASFIVIGIRGGTWEFGIFLAIPLVTLLFSYLFCFCVLIGIMTRSALASILLTAMFWGALYVVHMTDLALTRFATAADMRVEQHRRLVEANEALIRKNQALPESQRSNMSGFEFQLQSQTEALGGYQEVADSLNWWRNLVLSIKAPLPKTNETVRLMERWLVHPGLFAQAEQEERRQRDENRSRRGIPSRPTTRDTRNLGQFIGSDEVDEGVESSVRERSVAWVIGTSLGFEIVVLGLASWIFCRRDY